MTIATQDPAAKRRCRAHTSSRRPCQAWAIRGALVCVKHGGSAPQVKAKARQRLLEAADPVAAELVRLALDSSDENVRVRACVALLDRAGLGPTSTQVQVDGGQVNYQIEGVSLDQL